MVIQRDGTLRPMYGEPLPRKIVREKPDTYSKWTSMYHRMKKANRSFAQAIGFFVHEYGYWPPSDLPLMPKIDYHTFSKIKDVKVDELISTADHIEMREAAGKKPVPGVVDHLIQGKIF